MSNEAKVIRGQVRQVVKEIMPQLLTEQLVEQLSKGLASQLHKRIDQLQKQVQEALAAMDDRSRDVQAYIVRQHNLTTQAALNPIDTPIMPPQT